MVYMINFSYTMQIGHGEYIKIGFEKSFADNVDENEAFNYVYEKVMGWAKLFREKPYIEIIRGKRNI
ncbi:MAG: hypothetical protein NC827_05920 [Candidatus Omnitrophica bacterium]|nr:hypothetical protein [Candidatus Omnitrophota bacterium]